MSSSTTPRVKRGVFFRAEGPVNHSTVSGMANTFRTEIFEPYRQAQVRSFILAVFWATFVAVVRSGMQAKPS